MIKVFVRDTMKREEIVVDENSTTLREAFEKAGIDYDCGLISLNGKTMTEDALDCVFAEYTDKATAVLNVCRKTDNAASIVIAGKAVVVRSAATLGDIKKLDEAKPEALTLTKKDGEKSTEIFKVGVTELKPSFSQYGISFNSAGEDDELATITIVPVGDPEEYAAKVAGPAVLKLEQLELGFADAFAEIDAEAELIASHITRA